MIMKDLVSDTAQKASQAMQKTTEEVSKAVDAVNEKTADSGKGAEQAAKGFTKVKDAVEKTGDSVKGKLMPAVQATGKEVEKVAQQSGKVKDEVDKGTKSVGGFLATTKEVNDQIQKITKVFAIAGAAVKGVEAAWRGVQLVQAIVSNDFEKQVVAANRLQGVIESLPGGGAITQLGAEINNLFTGNKDYVEDLDRAVKKQEEHIARQKQIGEQQKQINDNAKSYLETLQGQADSIYRTQQQVNERSITELKKQRDLIAQTMGGVVSPQVRSQFIKDTDEIINHIASKQTTTMALAWDAANRELEEDNLRLINRTSEADRLAFQNSLQEKQIAAAKMGDRFAALQEKINNVLLAAFDREANKKRQDFLTSINTDLNTRALRATGDPGDARRAETLELQFRQQRQLIELNRSMNEQGIDPAQQNALRSRLADVQALEIQQNRVKQAIDEASTAEQRFADKMDAANTAAQTGATFGFEAQEKIKQAQAEYNAEIQKSIDLLQQLREQSTDPKQQQAIDQQIEKIRTSSMKANDQVQSFAKDAAGVISGSVESYTASILQSNADVKQSFKELINSIAAGFAQLAAKLLANLVIKKLIMSFAGGAGGGAGGGGDFSGGGYGGGGGADFGVNPQGYAEGGLVRGGTKGVDSVPARLMPDEYVLTPEMVPVFGLDFLESLRRQVLAGRAPVPRASSIPGFATGGQVSPSAAASGITGYPMITADESTANRLLAGGPNALVAHVGRNREAIRQVLGIGG